MFDPQTFLIFLAGALVLNFTPGPDMAFTLATSAKGGVRAGIAAALGVGAGSFVWAVLTAGGLAALLAASEHALTAVRIIGGGYLLYLAIKTFSHRYDMPGADGSVQMIAAFRSGFITNLFNPKVGLFFIAFLPTFTDAAAGHVWMQVLLLGAMFSVTGSLILIGVAAAAGRMRERLIQSRQLRGGLNSAAAATFGGLGLYLLFAPHR